MAKNTKTSLITTTVDTFIEAKEQEKNAKKVIEECKDFFKQTGLPEYEGTNYIVEAKSKAGSSRLNEDKLVQVLVDEAGLQVRRARELVEKSKVKSDDTVEYRQKKK